MDEIGDAAAEKDPKTCSRNLKTHTEEEMDGEGELPERANISGIKEAGVEGEASS